MALTPKPKKKKKTVKKKKKLSEVVFDQDSEYPREEKEYYTERKNSPVLL